MVKLEFKKSQNTQKFIISKLQSYKNLKFKKHKTQKTLIKKKNQNHNHIKVQTSKSTQRTAFLPACGLPNPRRHDD